MCARRTVEGFPTGEGVSLQFCRFLQFAHTLQGYGEVSLQGQRGVIVIAEGSSGNVGCLAVDHVGFFQFSEVEER